MRKFSVNTTFSLSDEILERIEQLHEQRLIRSKSEFARDAFEAAFKQYEEII